MPIKVGVGLPTGVPGTGGRLVLEWAGLADQGPFSSLGVVDRLVYGSYDPLISLAAVAGLTEHVRLVTMIVVSLMHNTAMFAKMAASLDALSGGRLVLGMAVGARREDFDAAGIDYRERGKRFSEQLAALRNFWEGDNMPAGARPGGPPMLIGGLSEHGFARMARYADGYVHGGGPPRAFARAADKARAAWQDSGRPGKPLLWGQGYFALGEQAAEVGRQYMRDYYAFTGPFAEKIAAGLLTTPQDVVQFVRGYEQAGCDEVILFPAVADIEQLKQLGQILDSGSWS